MTASLPVYKTRQQPTPKPIWSDGIHYVRPATPYELHRNPALAFSVMTNSKVTGKKKRATRRAASRSDAIEIAKRFTESHLEANPDDAAHLIDTQPVNKSTETPPSGEPVLEPFAITHFDCIHANPHAQVWQCTSYIGEKAPVGRRRQDGATATQTKFRHLKGHCSIMLGREPLRLPDGRLAIYQKWAEACEAADMLYEVASLEDEVLRWDQRQRYVVHRSPNFEVHYDPEAHGYKVPFVLWNLRAARYVLLNKTRPLFHAREQKPVDPSLNPQAHLDATERRRQRAREERVDSFSSEPMRFRSIFEATDKVDELERVYYT